ncbi:hypothetical protein KKB55_00120 [Myxococcota bacterium]|nr:hypothetical protein [Myxococcota bacterium]
METTEDELLLTITRDLKARVEALKENSWAWAKLLESMQVIREELFTDYIQNSNHSLVEQVYTEVERDYQDPYATKESHYEVFWYNVKYKSWRALGIPRVDEIYLINL